MAERRQRRHQKSLGGPNPYEGLESPKITISREDSETKETIRVANPEAAAEKAKELLKAQRESVDTLTMVKEKILDKLSDTEFRQELETNGYGVVDHLLGDTKHSNSPILSELLEETKVMLEHGDMEIDQANLGKGQYIAAIGGGEKLYGLCPRLVEFVVSTTKHVPEAFGAPKDDKNDNNDDSNDNYVPSVLELCDSACMATLRSFDRQNLKASLELLKVEDEDAFLNNDEVPCSVIADANDQRKLSLFYYIVPPDWNKNMDCGGGLVLQNEFYTVQIFAVPDRLLVVYSDTKKCKPAPWRGNDNNATSGNVLELHLIGKRESKPQK